VKGKAIPVTGHEGSEEPNDLIGNRTHDLLACSIVPQPTTLQP
jgi:hypothetical protein